MDAYKTTLIHTDMDTHTQMLWLSTQLCMDVEIEWRMIRALNCDCKYVCLFNTKCAWLLFGHLNGVIECKQMPQDGITNKNLIIENSIFLFSVCYSIWFIKFSKKIHIFRDKQYFSMLSEREKNEFEKTKHHSLHK